MIRTFVLIFSCACVAVVLSEGAAVFLLWQRGALTPHNVREVQLILRGELDPEPKSRILTTTADPQVAYAEVQSARAKKVLDIARTEDGLGTLQQSIVAARRQVEEQQLRFRTEQQAFSKKLDELEKILIEASTEQARGVLLALPPVQAADKLAAVPLDDALVLMKAMPEKNIAKILKEFAGTKEKLERGQKLFDGLYKGQPQKALLDQARAQFPSPGSPPAAP